MGGLDLHRVGHDKMDTEYRSFATRLRLDFATVVRKSIENMRKVPAAAYSCSSNDSRYSFFGR